MTLKRVANFYPGPSALPLEVLQEAQEGILNYKDNGLSLMEMSHRSPAYDEIHQGTKKVLRDAFGVPEEFEIIFMGGGASTQFYVAPLNLLKPDETVDFIHTGTWTKNAIKEAKRIAKVHIAASGEESKFTKIPETFNFSSEGKYVHICSNNTIYGTQWQKLPDTQDKPVVIDMSSDIMSYPVDFSNIWVIFAGAQKNLGCAGVTVVIIRKSIAEQLGDELPTMLNYKTFVSSDSLNNTPPCWNIYIVKLYMEWVQRQGGLLEMQRRANKKSGLIYEVMDEYPEFYQPIVDKGSRSKMNVVFRLPDENLEKEFTNEAKALGFLGLKGHRSVGGMRASLYNAVEVEWVENLVTFMRDFKKKH